MRLCEWINWLFFSMNERVKPWRVIQSKIAYQKKWMRVNEDTCELPDGRIISPYLSIIVPDFCNVVMITDQQEVVMVKQYRHAAGILSVELPGGMIDAGEDPLTAAKREMQEETGYTSEDIELLYSVNPNPPLEQNKAWFYLAKGVELTNKTAFDAFEDIELLLMPKADFVEMLLNHSFTHGIQAGAMYAAAIRLGWVGAE